MSCKQLSFPPIRGYISKHSYYTRHPTRTISMVSNSDRWTIRRFGDPYQYRQTHEGHMISNCATVSKYCLLHKKMDLTRKTVRDFTKSMCNSRPPLTSGVARALHLVLFCWDPPLQHPPPHVFPTTARENRKDRICILHSSNTCHKIYKLQQVGVFSKNRHMTLLLCGTTLLLLLHRVAHLEAVVLQAVLRFDLRLVGFILGPELFCLLHHAIDLRL